MKTQEEQITQLQTDNFILEQGIGDILGEIEMLDEYHPEIVLSSIKTICERLLAGIPKDPAQLELIPPPAVSKTDATKYSVSHRKNFPRA